MKKNKLLFFTKIMYSLFAISTIIVLLMVYDVININPNIEFKFIMVYVGLTFFLLAYIPIVTMLNLRTLKWVRIKKMLIRFIALFTLLFISSYIFDYVFKSSNMNLLKNFSNAFGLAFGISFFEVIFLKKEDLKK